MNPGFKLLFSTWVESRGGRYTWHLFVPSEFCTSNENGATAKTSSFNP